MTLGSKIATVIGAKFGAPDVHHKLRRIFGDGQCRIALDIGCGISSNLTRYRPHIKTIGLDAFTIEDAVKSNAHDHYISADILEVSVDELRARLKSMVGQEKADVVTLFGVIEHFPKSVGLEVLQKIEQLTNRYLVIDTPNGFVPQGPEYGNPYQRHLSGWFPHDFEGLGYNVYGSLGTKYARGYMGEPRVRLPGIRLLDNVILARLYRTQSKPHHAFNICAIKDITGVPARYTSYDDPNRL